MRNFSGEFRIHNSQLLIEGFITIVLNLYKLVTWHIILKAQNDHHKVCSDSNFMPFMLLFWKFSSPQVIRKSCILMLLKRKRPKAWSAITAVLWRSLLFETFGVVHFSFASVSKDYCIQPVCEYNNRDLQLCPSPLTSIVNIILIFPSLSNYMRRILLHLFQSSSKKIFKFGWKPLNLDC